MENCILLRETIVKDDKGYTTSKRINLHLFINK